MPTIPIGVLVKLLARYGPVAANAYKRLSNLTPEHRAKLVAVLEAGAPRRQLRKRVDGVLSTLKAQHESIRDTDEKVTSESWITQLTSLQKRLDLADAMPTKQRRVMYKQVLGDFVGLLKEIAGVTPRGPDDPDAPVGGTLPP